jgi:hypothetical protein
VHDVLPRGTLEVSEPRELLVLDDIPGVRVPGAYEPDGSVARDTMLRPHPVKNEIPDEEVVQVYDEEVIWGGKVHGHYGHFLTESVARLWPLLPGARYTELPVVFMGRDQPPFAIEWLRAFGASLVKLPERGAICFKRMLVPELAWRMGAWISPEIRDIHLQARRGLTATELPRCDVLWLSRSRLEPERVAYDEVLLEWLLRAHVTVIRPEEMALAAQVGAIESCRCVAGVVGSAFHTLMMAAEPPEALYLCPPFEKGTFAAQHRVMDADATFVQALAGTTRMRRTRDRVVMAHRGYRVLIPKALRALSAVLPSMGDDLLLASLAWGEQREQESSSGPSADLEAAVKQVVYDPFSAEKRTQLGSAFQEQGLSLQAAEQFGMAEDLAWG